MTQIKRIDYKCTKTPEGNSLKGFVKGTIYKGRSFNGLYEISTEWASHQPTHLLDGKEFEKYFEVVDERKKIAQEV